jgi:hypothetical protein
VEGFAQRRVGVDGERNVFQARAHLAECAANAA